MSQVGSQYCMGHYGKGGCKMVCLAWHRVGALARLRANPLTYSGAPPYKWRTRRDQPACQKTGTARHNKVTLRRLKMWRRVPVFMETIRFRSRVRIVVYYGAGLYKLDIRKVR